MSEYPHHIYCLSVVFTRPLKEREALQFLVSQKFMIRVWAPDQFRELNRSHPPPAPHTPYTTHYGAALLPELPLTKERGMPS